MATNPWIDLGGGHRIQVTKDWTSFVEEHRDLRDPSRSCAGSGGIEGGPIAEPGRSWKLKSREPLTLTPSIQCTVCGNHGFVTDGKWVPA